MWFWKWLTKLDGEANRVGMGALELDNWEEGIQEIENAEKMRSRFCPSLTVQELEGCLVPPEKKISVLDFRSGAFKS